MTQFEWKDIFGDNLVSLLQERKMSQAQLAKKSGVSTGMISDYVNKRAIPGLIAAINISYALDVGLNELVDFDEMIE